ncbi:hypothetical protein ACGFYA_15810 [Streptomyces sp. NPDC048305]|uniref:hypothetical protein n=1 Tax=Streptomyces sp. NPDC048305 TaxID=3365532 RepID=UPI0037199EE3
MLRDGRPAVRTAFVEQSCKLFLGSANLTESAARRNIEAGALIRGGDAPQRAAGHIVELQHRGVLWREAG